MKKYMSRLLLLVMLAVFLYGGSSFTSQTAHSAFTPLQDCKEGCAQKRDLTLKRCERLSGDGKTNCQKSANDQYTSCIQGCDSGMGGNTGKP
jgi:hypothetical protein